MNTSSQPSIDTLRARHKSRGVASFFFHDYGFKSSAVKLLPGEYYVDVEGVMMMTVLGSCVSACVFDKRTGVGGMNHFMLPEGGDGSGRYGLFAMEVLINELIKRGARKSSLEAKIFGGGAVVKEMSSVQIGRRNVEFVENFMNQEGIPIVSREVLDRYPRKLVFFGPTGKAMVKKLPIDRDNTASREKEYAQRAAVSVDKGGDVELF